MAKILIKNRAEIERMSFAPNTAVISITDVNWHFAKLKSEPNFLLKLAFDDVDNDIFLDVNESEKDDIAKKYHMLSDEQAEQIANFYLRIQNSADIIICQCEHGQSRSAAVAAAILEYRNRSGIKVFANDKYYPNKAVFNKILNKLKAIR